MPRRPLVVQIPFEGQLCRERWTPTTRRCQGCGDRMVWRNRDRLYACVLCWQVFDSDNGPHEASELLSGILEQLAVA